ncbi:MAG: FtsW/RodA/SpoVE family cell cycle protein [Patescibacteria group bacterium]
MWTILPLIATNLLMVRFLAPNLLGKQLVALIVGLVFLVLIKLSVSLNWWKQKQLIYGASLIFLLSPILLGGIIRGSSRWLELGGFSIQPSELTRPFIILSLALFLEKRSIKNWLDFLKIVLLIALPVLLILIQPDLGSAAILALVLLVMLWFHFPSIKHFLGLAILGLAGLLLFGGLFFHSYQITRLTQFLNQSKDPLGAGYNLIQAKIAIGSGSWLGRGVGQGRQTQLAYLPEKHTDFVFASIAEETGFLGVGFLLFFYYLFLKTLQNRLEPQSDSVTSYLKLGIFLAFFIQFSINVAMNLGLFPVVGVPLPLVSYGGSSLLSSLIGLGLFYAL